jgi:hypothetical protein
MAQGLSAGGHCRLSPYVTGWRQRTTGGLVEGREVCDGATEAEERQG